MLAQRIGRGLAVGIMFLGPGAMAQVALPVAIASKDFGFLRYNDNFPAFMVPRRRPMAMKVSNASIYRTTPMMC